MISVTPIFDQLNMEWKTQGWTLPFGLAIKADTIMLPPEEVIDMELGILPLYDSFESSFPNEQLDFTPGAAHVIITEAETPAPGMPGMQQAVAHPSGQFRVVLSDDLDTLTPEQIKNALATTCAPQHVAWILSNAGDLLNDPDVNEVSLFGMLNWEQMEDLWHQGISEIVSEDEVPDDFQPSVHDALFKCVELARKEMREMDEANSDSSVAKPISITDRAARKKD